MKSACGAFGALLVSACGSPAPIPETSTEAMTRLCQERVETLITQPNRALWGGEASYRDDDVLTVVFKYNDGSFPAPTYSAKCRFVDPETAPRIFYSELGGAGQFQPGDMLQGAPGYARLVRNLAYAREQLPALPPLDASNLSAADFPGEWGEEGFRGVSISLGRAGIAGCGEFLTKVLKDHPDRYLVYCTRDGETWIAHYIDTKTGQVQTLDSLIAGIPKPY